MDTNQLRHVLSELRFTADLPDRALENLAEEAQLLNYRAGSIIFREGTSTDSWLLIHDGRVVLEMNVPGRGPVPILTLGPGDMVGWSALVGGAKMTATALAVDDTEAVLSPADKVLAICEQDHEFGYALMRRVAESLATRLVATRLQLLDLFADSNSEVATSQNEKS